LAVGLVLTACVSALGCVSGCASGVAPEAGVAASGEDASGAGAAALPTPAERPGDIGVVRPSHYSESALIETFDEELKLQGRGEFAYAGLENAWGVPALSEGIIYLVVQGLEGKRDARLVIGYDLVTGETREYPVDLPALKSVAATDRFLFVTSVINGSSTVARVDKQSGEVVFREFAEDFLVGITACGQRLAVFRQPDFDFTADASLLILDEELEVLSTVPLQGLGSASQMSLVAGDLLCFGASREDAGSPTGYRNTLNTYSLASGELRTLAESDHHYGFSALVAGRLVVLQSEVNVAAGNGVFVCDPQSGDALAWVGTDYMPQHLLAQDDLLYVAGLDQALGTYRLQRYRLEGDGFGDRLALVAEASLESGETLSYDYGVGGLYPSGG
jgi:hypothetical protein